MCGSVLYHATRIELTELPGDLPAVIRGTHCVREQGMAIVWGWGNFA